MTLSALAEPVWKEWGIHCIHIATMANSTKNSDIVIDDTGFELLSERPFTMIRMYRSVVESDDPIWKVKFAEEAVEAMGICSKFVHESFLLHSRELLFKESSETNNWRKVKSGIFSTITIKGASIGLGSGIKVRCFDDCSLSKVESELDELVDDKENSPVPPLCRKNMARVCRRSSLFTNNAASTNLDSSGMRYNLLVLFGSYNPVGSWTLADSERIRILNETINSLEISDEEEIDYFDDCFFSNADSKLDVRVHEKENTPFSPLQRNLARVSRRSALFSNNYCALATSTTGNSSGMRYFVLGRSCFWHPCWPRGLQPTVSIFGFSTKLSTVWKSAMKKKSIMAYLIYLRMPRGGISLSEIFTTWFYIVYDGKRVSFKANLRKIVLFGFVVYSGVEIELSSMVTTLDSVVRLIRDTKKIAWRRPLRFLSRRSLWSKRALLHRRTALYRYDPLIVLLRLLRNMAGQHSSKRVPDEENPALKTQLLVGDDLQLATRTSVVRIREVSCLLLRHELEIR
jgi:hypothetical protein